LALGAHGSPEQDEIAKVIAAVDKINSRAAAEESIRDLLDQNGFNKFKLGGFLLKLRMNPEWWNDSYSTYSAYVESTFGFSSEKAARAIRLYKKLLILGLPWSAFAGIGWIKVDILLRIVTKENVAEWVEKAKAMNALSLRATIQQQLQHPAPAGALASDVKTFTLKLHPDQKEIIDAAVEKAKQEVPTGVDAVAFTAIAQSYLGAGISFTDWEQALAYAAQHAEQPVELICEVIAELEKLLPMYIIDCVVTPKS
jgi:hypothetical protein